MTDYLYTCGQCGTQYNSQQPALPADWTADDHSRVLCANCNAPAYDPFVAGPATFVGKPTDHVRHGFFAVYMPQRKMVAFHFPRGLVEFSVEEAADIADAFNEVVLVSRGQHTGQCGFAERHGAGTCAAHPFGQSNAAVDLTGREMAVAA